MMSTTSTTAAAAAGRSSNKFPFTATQWQELEHQALIYKYMAAGIPIPPDLLFSIKRSLDSSLSSKLFTYQPSPLGWNAYQMGYGKKIDPEPGRCRRTDGKKWRCSKEAYPDSKYCERHMHRGKNRSRKPVENNNTTSTTNNNNSSLTTSLSSNSATTTTTTSNSSTHSAATATFITTPKTHSSLYSLSSFPSSDHSPYSNNSHLLYPHHSPSSYSPKDYSTRERYYQGMKEDVGEHAFFTESSGSSSMRGFSASSMDESWPLGGDHSKNSGNGGYPNYLQQLQSSKNNSRDNSSSKQQEKQQCYIWGNDFNCELSMKVEEEERERAAAAAAAAAAAVARGGGGGNDEKPIHHFFDEWPLKGGGGGGRDSSWHDSSSTTQLSISIPSSTSHPHDFFLSNSRSP